MVVVVVVVVVCKPSLVISLKSKPRMIKNSGPLTPWRIGTLKYLEIGPIGPNGTKRSKMGPDRVKRG